MSPGVKKYRTDIHNKEAQAKVKWNQCVLNFLHCPGSNINYFISGFKKSRMHSA